MAAKINKNRYRLITLLYVIFVCLSVLNIPATYLDSNSYAIKTLMYQEKARLNAVDFANRLIAEQKDKLQTDTAKVYLDIQGRIHKAYEFMNKFDETIVKKLAAENTTVMKELASKKKMEEIFMHDSLIYQVQREFMDLVKYLNSKPFQIDQAIKELTPVSELVMMQSGKEVEWARYLFLHKPTAISYFQVKRLKLLLLDNENVYQNAALRTIGYLPSYYSEKEKRAVMDDKTPVSKVIDNQQLIENQKKIDSTQKSTVSAAFPKFPVQADQAYTKASNTDNFDEFIQRIITSLHAESFYVGIPNPVLKEFNYLLGSDFGFEIVPKAGAEIQQVGFNYNIVFRNTGEYTFKFTDKRDGGNKLVFEKKVRVFVIPNPLVKLNGDILTRDIVNVKDLFASNRLVGYLGITEIPTFPGRINSYRVTRISKNADQESVENYSDVFTDKTSNLISKLQKGDVILFSNILVTLVDGTTRTANPLTYKIVE